MYFLQWLPPGKQCSNRLQAKKSIGKELAISCGMLADFVSQPQIEDVTVDEKEMTMAKKIQ
jgi:hypothetical protein